MRASGYERASSDWYVEPAWIVDALIAAERQFGGIVWDPCCGGGNIPRRFEAAGIHAAGSDVIDRAGYPLHDFFGDNVLQAHSIVCNPPYDRACDFIDRALTLTRDRVCVLLRLAFLEGQARRTWFSTVPLARVWVSSRRVSMPPGGTDVPAKGGAIAYAWFVFEHGHTGPYVGGWV